MAQFSIPASPTIYSYESQSFLGADFTSDSTNVDDTKSPNCENMIRSVPGKVRKRMGYKFFSDYHEHIYGVHKFSVTNALIVHAGNKLYNMNAIKGSKWIDDSRNEIVDDNSANIMFLDGSTENQLLYEGMAEHRSVSFQLNQKLVILDGSNIYIYDGQTVQPLSTTLSNGMSYSEIAYVPTLTISKDPNGGGTDYEPLNLLQPAFIEQFVVTQDHATAKTFQMSFKNLNEVVTLEGVTYFKPEVWLLNSQGEWVQKTYGTDFTYSAANGTITFATAPGASPLTGEDNVKIKVCRNVRGYTDRIRHCQIGAMFGVNGANDRLFVSGNPDYGEGTDGELYSYINYDWFSQQYDPTYFGDTWYAKLGSDSSAIMGYSIINNYLAAHKDKNELTQSILIREGDLKDSEPSFPLINTLQGSGAISKYCFSYLATEPVFLSNLGIYAVTAQDITGEKYAQDRSYYLEGKLLKEPHLEDAFAITWKDYYILCVNDHFYILDGLQPMHTDKSRPYATRQYAGFYFTNIAATCLFVYEDELYFGTDSGKIYKFYTDPAALESYSDDGQPIKAVWETADISEKKFYKNKTYRYVALRCMPEIYSSVLIEAQKNGIWQDVKRDEVTLKYLSFANVTFSKFTFSCNTTQRVTSSKMRIKKVDHIRFRFSNEVLNEPLGINNFACEFTQGTNKK